MNTRKYFISYNVNGLKVETDTTANDHFELVEELSDNLFKVTIKPKCKFTLNDFKIVIDKEFADDDRFFAGGYQSWSTTKEFTKKDVQKGVSNITKISGYTYNLATICSDEKFHKYTAETGKFHSVTYTYIRNGKDVELFGSLSERQGYTMFNADMINGKFEIAKDVENVVVSEDYNILELAMYSGTYDEVFDKYFDAMDIPECKIDHMSGYTSWYNYFQNIDENIILRDLDGLDPVKDSVSIFQIDDGFETFVGDWLDPNPAKFPSGLKYVVDRIHAKGYMAGLWLAPFCCQKASKTFKEHPDWFIKDKNGKPELGIFNWGGAYTLDIYNDEARAYIKKFFDVVLNEWGFDMVKLDFLYTQCKTPRHGKSRGQIMCEAMDLLRECVGEKLLLGCGVPIGPAFGKVDACRISCDVDLNYVGKFYTRMRLNNEIPSAQCAITSTMFRRHLNGRVWVNDPDVFFLRDTNLKFTDEQKLLLAHINNLCGDVLFVSDNVGDYNERGLKLVQKFFKKSECQVTDITEVDSNIFRIRYIQNGKKMVLTFDLKKGKILK